MIDTDSAYACMYVLPLSSAVSGGGNVFTNGLGASLVTVVCHTSHSYYWRLTFRASQLCGYCSKVAVGTLVEGYMYNASMLHIEMYND